MKLMVPRLAALLGLFWLSPTRSSAGEGSFRLEETLLTIPQVDYEGAIYFDDSDPIPHLDLKKVRWEVVVQKEHRAVVLETEYLRLTLLPEMGRVYSMVYKPTGHETLWRNDIARPGGGNNDSGWWLWIGGVEYTLPGDEHGTTWALPWSYSILEDGERRKAVRMQVTEPKTGLRESIDISVYPAGAAFEADIRIWNPGPDTVRFAHWVNPMWAPGGANELTDNTEFIIPTERILIEERWQANMGPSPQVWPGNPLRFIANWAKMGDLMADGLSGGFFSAYSHDAEEGVVRVFDPLKNPGFDMWTYGFHPTDIPMGSGAPNKGYAEMWGGTVATFPDEVRPLGPDASLTWTEWMYPYQKTGGLSFANQVLAANCQVSDSGDSLYLAVCPARPLQDASVEIRNNGTVVLRQSLAASPDHPFSTRLELVRGARADGLLVILREGQREIGRFRP